MTDIEIFDTYEALFENDAFEAFEARNVNHETIVNVLGYDVATAYIAWIKRFIK